MSLTSGYKRIIFLVTLYPVCTLAVDPQWADILQVVEKLKNMGKTDDGTNREGIVPCGALCLNIVGNTFSIQNTEVDKLHNAILPEMLQSKHHQDDLSSPGWKSIIDNKNAPTWSTSDKNHSSWSPSDDRAPSWTSSDKNHSSWSPSDDSASSWTFSDKNHSFWITPENSVPSWTDSDKNQSSWSISDSNYSSWSTADKMDPSWSTGDKSHSSWSMGDKGKTSWSQGGWRLVDGTPVDWKTADLKSPDPNIETQFSLNRISDPLSPTTEKGGVELERSKMMVLMELIGTQFEGKQKEKLKANGESKEVKDGEEIPSTMDPKATGKSPDLPQNDTLTDGTQMKYVNNTWIEEREYPDTTLVCGSFNSTFQGPPGQIEAEIAGIEAKLLAYLKGENTQNKSQEMNLPVIYSMTNPPFPSFIFTLCHWLAQSKPMSDFPEPLYPSLYLVERQMGVYYSRTFSGPGGVKQGRAWGEETYNLEKALESEGLRFESNISYGVTYSSPDVKQNRRDEVMFKKL